MNDKCILIKISFLGFVLFYSLITLWCFSSSETTISLNSSTVLGKASSGASSIFLCFSYFTYASRDNLVVNFYKRQKENQIVDNQRFRQQRDEEKEITNIKAEMLVPCQKI